MLKYGGWRFSRRAVTGVLAVISIFCLARSVNATEDGCAVVLKTPDGFLNLRKAPTTKSDIVTQLKQGDFLYVDTTRCETKGNLSICDEDNPPRWTHVTSARRIDGKDARTFTQGWVSDQYVQWFRCEED
jgi:hypothetical protein